MDENKLRRMAGLPLLTERQLSQLEEAKKKKKEAVPAELPPEEVAPATDVAPAATPDEEELPKIITKIAGKAEGKTGDELVVLIKQVYDAGVKDGVASTKEEKPAKDEKPAKEKPAKDEEIVEAAEPLVPHFGLEDENNAKIAALEIAKAGVPVDMEFAMGIFYFNFKNKKQYDVAFKTVSKKVDLKKEESGQFPSKG